MKTVTTQIVLDKRTKRKDGTYPVKLRVTSNRSSRKYGIGINMIEKDFEKSMMSKPRGMYKTARLTFNTWEQKALDIIAGLPHFDFEEFKRQLLGTPKAKLTLQDLFEEKISDLEDNNQLGTAQTYRYTLVSLLKFKSNLQLHHVKESFLKKYEHWFLESGNSHTSLGMYCRNLRHIMNVAVQKELITPEAYPFGTGKYVIPKKQTTKKALSKEEIKAIYEYQDEFDSKSCRQKARDFFFLHFLCNGCNTTDLLRLKGSDIKDDYIEFIRQKTKRTSKGNIKPIRIHLSDEIKELMNKWGDIKNDGYILDVLKEGMSEREIKKAVAAFNRVFNEGMKKVVAEVGIEVNTTGWAYICRHTYFTHMMASGASIAYLMDSAGHKNVQTTMTYIKSLDTAMQVEQTKTLLSFTG